MGRARLIRRMFLVAGCLTLCLASSCFIIVDDDDDDCDDDPYDCDHPTTLAQPYVWSLTV